MMWSEEDSIPQRFDRVARRHPDKVAIVEGGRALSYQELGRLAHRYAAALPSVDACGDEMGARAALLLDHGSPVLAGALAALHSGFTVVV